MKLDKLFLIVLIISLALVGCQSGTDSAENPEQSQSSDQEIQDNAPEQAVEVQDAYPAPQSEPTAPLPAVLYPMYADGDEIGWVQAQAMIKNDEVERIVQTHELKVTLFLKDGRALVTIEPEIDDVLKIIEECGENCSSIAVATE